MDLHQNTIEFEHSCWSMQQNIWETFCFVNWAIK